MVTVVTACATDKNTARGRWFHSFHARYNIYYNGSQAYIDASLEREQGNVDNFTELIPLYTVGNKASLELGQANYDRAIEKSQKAIQRHSIKKRPVWNKRRRKTERDIEWLNRKEYNPFLWKAWMLMGRSQFMKGNFDEAASTFAYMSRLYRTQPAIYGKARAWLAKCYIEEGWIYDAEDVITKIQRDSIHWRAQKEWDYTYADYYIHTGRYAEAIPYLRKVIRHEMRRKQRAREWYLLGQLYEELGNKEMAYKAYRRVIRLNPPYLLEFNARIAMTEVMAGGKPKQMIRKLKRMARSDKNKDYLEQVYYAIGNIYLAEKDTSNAIANYEKGYAKATRTGIEKGVLLLTLGDLYWEKEDYSNSRRCYGEAIGLLDKERKDYEQLSKRSSILDELVPYTDAIHLQDSLLELSEMSEDDRNAAIDRVIEALIKKEEEERKAQEEAEAEATVAQQQAIGAASTTSTATSSTSEGSTFYFYNPTAVTQGKSTFEKLWGRRQNVDDWQRVNKTVVATEEEVDEEELTDEQRDSLLAAEALQDSLEASADSAVNNPHKREYYLKQIPFTPEQKAECHKTIADGLYNSGVIFKDKLYNLPRSEKQFMRLLADYPNFERMADAYYHLYLLYSQKGMPEKADSYLQLLKDSFPTNNWTILLSDPYYAENMRFGTHIEDSLYAAAYDAFKRSDYTTVATNSRISEQRFPLGANRDKFIFIDGMSKLNSGDSDGCLEAMNKVVTNYPKSDVSELAGMIVNGVKAGRQLTGGTFDIGNVWDRRTAVLNDSDSIASMKFIAERDVPFICLIAFQPDSVEQNKLLFEVARFNFSNFIVRNFDMSFDTDGGLQRMIISGFNSYDEALQYTRQMYKATIVEQLLRKARVILISERNLELLGRQYSYNDYDDFYESHFVPLRVSTVRLLTEPATIEYEPEPEEEETPGDNDIYGDDELYNGGVLGDEMLIDLDMEDEFDEGTEISIPEEEGDSLPAIEGENIIEEEPGAIIIDEESLNEPAETEQTTTVATEEEEPESPAATEPEATPEMPAEDTTPAEEAPADVEEAPAAEEEPVNVVEEETIDVMIDDETITVVEDEDIETPATEEPGAMEPATEEPAVEPEEPAEQPQSSQPTYRQQQYEDTGIDFNDDFGAPATPQNSGNNKRQKQEIDIEDEYYDLDGF